MKKIFLALLLLFLFSSVSASITFVQMEQNSSDGSDTKIDSPTMDITSGNTIIAVVAWYRSTTQTATVADDIGGNTYVSAIKKNPASGLVVEIFYAKNVTGGNTKTVTATFSAPTTFRSIIVYEFSGIDITNPLDQTSSANGSNASPASPQITTTTNSEVIIAGTNIFDPRTQTAGDGYTIARGTSAYYDAEYKIVSSTGNFTGEFTLSGATLWTTAMATFEETNIITPVAAGSFSLTSVPFLFLLPLFFIVIGILYVLLKWQGRGNTMGEQIMTLQEIMVVFSIIIIGVIILSSILFAGS